MAGHTYNAETYKAAKKEVWKVTFILSALTIVELFLGFILIKNPEFSSSLVLFLKGTILILMMVKAFYIVAYFMHLKHEIKNMIMTIVVPLALFIWFITAFLYEGNSYRNLKNTYDRNFKEQSTIKSEKKDTHGGDHSKDASGNHGESKPAGH